MGPQRKGLRVTAPIPKQKRDFAGSRFRLKRPLIVLAIVAAVALVLGFLAFGGANMGN
jgi:hypothetical protein